MGIFDTHAHYDDQRFDSDREALFASLSLPDEINPLGVERVLHCATDLASSLVADRMSRQTPFLYAAVGFHPGSADRFVPEDLATLEALCRNNEKIVAIGECGLEYHYDFVPKDTQKRVLEEMFLLSQRLGLPIILHDREAHGDTCDFIYRHPKAFGIIHSFSGSFEMAKDLTRRGWYISYSGSVTFKTAENLRKSVEAVPMEQLLVETDAPYLTPVPYRGKRNDSRYCYHTLCVLAQIKGVSVEEMANITKENACRLLKIYT